MSKVTLNPDSLKQWQANNLEYLRYEEKLSATDLILDIGAHMGEWSDRYVRTYHCRAILVEPTEYIRTYNQAGRVINKAASTHNGTLQFGGGSYYTSIFEPTNHEYPCFDIAEVLTEEVALCKINVEGSEYELLQHIIDKGLRKLLKVIQVQFHEIEGVPYAWWYKKIAESLSETHELQWRYPYCWEQWKWKES